MATRFTPAAIGLSAVLATGLIAFGVSRVSQPAAQPPPVIQPPAVTPQQAQPQQFPPGAQWAIILPIPSLVNAQGAYPGMIWKLYDQFTGQPCPLPTLPDGVTPCYAIHSTYATSTDAYYGTGHYTPVLAARPSYTIGNAQAGYPGGMMTKPPMVGGCLGNLPPPPPPY